MRDTDDYANGAAYYYQNTIELWATSLDFELRGTSEWLSNVLTHELTHILSLRTAREGTPADSRDLLPRPGISERRQT